MSNPSVYSQVYTVTCLQSFYLQYLILYSGSNSHWQILPNALHFSPVCFLFPNVIIIIRTRKLRALGKRYFTTTLRSVHYHCSLITQYGVFNRKGIQKLLLIRTMIVWTRCMLDCVKENILRTSWYHLAFFFLFPSLSKEKIFSSLQIVLNFSFLKDNISEFLIFCFGSKRNGESF